MIYKISKPNDTVIILGDDPTGLIVFDLKPEVDPSEITIALKECTECGKVAAFGLDDNDQEYCEGDCEGYLDGIYAGLVIQGDKVLFAQHRRPQ